ncbi:phosphoribosyltransferase [Leucobacter denitrificans]|uniref:Phosphoribosyltransferase n=1 Tax=Leucobacter denitrificans TaxID=683042 RepID=A0A7G9S237_9MICO|nr:phosphoribosyltransferase family protein [Leucobacter denitrificans]QNN61912.1 phosphoribosyltransferase [Leucobacter denitrificans]
MENGGDSRPYADRSAAGAVLAGVVAEALAAQGAEGDDPPIVLALPRGGVPVAEPVAAALGVPLNVLIVRKLGMPGQPEVAMGAVAAVGETIVRVENPELAEAVRQWGADAKEAEQIEAAEVAELRRRRADYRRGRSDLDLADRTVLLVDDGVATGATALAAIRAARAAGAARVILALPVIVGSVPAAFLEEVDEVLCPWIAPRLHAVGMAYLDFRQVSDAEVLEILEQAKA